MNEAHCANRQPIMFTKLPFIQFLGGTLWQWMESLWTDQLKDTYCLYLGSQRYMQIRPHYFLAFQMAMGKHVREGAGVKGTASEQSIFFSIEPRKKTQSWLYHNCAVPNWANQSPEQKLKNTCHFSLGYPTSKPPANIMKLPTCVQLNKLKMSHTHFLISSQSGYGHRTYAWPDIPHCVRISNE